MKTVAEATLEIIRKSPFLEEALSDGLINISGLARKIQPEVEEVLHKEVNVGAITMAINRYSPTKILSLNRNIKNNVKDLGDFTIRYGIVCATVSHDNEFFDKHRSLMRSIDYSDRGSFFTFGQGITESSYIFSENYLPEFENAFKNSNLLFNKRDQAIININLPKALLELPGAYYYILKELAWQNINITEIVSTSNELTIVVDNEQANLVFGVLSKLKFN